MYDTKKLELRLRQAEAKCEALQELLVLLSKALIPVSPAGAAIQAQLRDASAYTGPSVAKKELASLARAVAELK
ncbi:hypothetical protein [Stenotrophomonas sp. GD04032]|uniref:hypothetical protein n=1 Tax=Stenotrophomonas sp. GD04032 TaxID=2975424 RepID=UPI002449DD3E|nr:hypothetical protein [Stenotrophomonas sp. GD04032]MDG9972948.1 hypothetical protein [Stenotrophomonas sp. GD04032]